LNNKHDVLFVAEKACRNLAVLSEILPFSAYVTVCDLEKSLDLVTKVENYVFRFV